jgi:putative hemolysin
MYQVILFVFVLALNSFFSAAEVALISTRESRMRSRAEQGSAGAQAALALLNNPERLLSVTQVGITLASLALGWVGESTMHGWLMAIFHPWITPEIEAYSHAASFAVAFLIITFLHVVIGEVVPKNMAIEKADDLAVLLSPSMLIFAKAAAPFVIAVERTSAVLSRSIGVKHTHGGGGHSPEELMFLVRSSRKEGFLEGFEEAAIHKLLELRDWTAREIMTPRIEIVSVPIDAPLDELLRVAVEHKFSRLPIYENAQENIIGVVHYKDLMQAWQERKLAADRRIIAPPFQLRRFLRKPLVVPETKPLNQLVDEFRRNHTHMATVVDEFGTVAGLVTMEDVLEQVFGEIGDEHDVRRALPAANAPLIEVEGATSIRDLSTQYGIELPTEAGFETLAGFLLYRIGEIPAKGSTVQYGSRKFIVTQMERNRITMVRIETESKA